MRSWGGRASSRMCSGEQLLLVPSQARFADGEKQLRLALNGVSFLRQLGEKIKLPTDDRVLDELVALARAQRRTLRAIHRQFKVTRCWHCFFRTAFATAKQRLCTKRDPAMVALTFCHRYALLEPRSLPNSQIANVTTAAIHRRCRRPLVTARATRSAA